MNCAGKFDATFPSEGPDTHSHAYTHVDSSQTHAPADAIIVPDAQLLFHADYSRSGTDLILSRDHHEYVVHDYFHGQKRAPLASPDGAHLTADIVKALVGEVEVSQAGTAPAASQVIGHVTKLQGSATVIRNGVSVILNMGDNVEKGDVVESGASSTVGITFIDGTVFGLSSNARMVLNEMVYDPNGSSNSSLMSLVAGTITFVAGETAKHGDMKIDTPVATMGIRGTAVLVEIDFSVPGQGGQPNASFQVLVEPDGTTGSYILFDKNTLQPIAIVNQAGQQININNGIINITTNPLTPDLQKLITDVFQQKFTDNTNTKSTSPSTDSIIPTSNPLVIKIGETVITTQTVSVQGSSTQAPPTTQSSSTFHVSGPPTVQIANLLGVETSSFSTTEQAGLTGSPLPDGAVGTVSFNDINVGDRPSVSAAFSSFTYKDAHGHDVTGSLSALQLADIAATEVNLTIIPGANNTNVGSSFFIYSVADQSFDFLAAGEQLTLTYYITVNENYAPDPSAKITIPITITITGTNDAPVTTTSAQSITFVASGTKTVGGDLQTANPTSGTLKFTDVDLTDTHTVSAALTKVVMSNGGTLPPLPESVFENALTASIGVDSTGTGNGTINWQLASLQTYLADFIPLGVTVTLTYTVTVTDSQGATATQTITVIVPGDESPAVVWIHTTTDGHDNLWSDKLNWETGTVPVATDDVIISTNQLHPDTPAYPVTIDGTTAAVANSVTMNDFVNLAPELDVLKGGSLTIGAALSMSADSILHNAGTVSVGGAIELLDTLDTNGKFLALNQSVIVNSGTLTLGQGGDFQGSASITNTGLIDLTGGVLNVLVDITNSGTGTEDESVGGKITVEGSAKLALGTDTNKGGGHGGITGGTVTIIGELDLQGSNFVDSGTLSNSGNVFVAGLGNSFDAEKITNTGAIELKSGAALAIDQGSSVSGSGTIKIDGTATLTLDDAIIDGNKITNGGGIDIKDAVTLQDKASVTNSASTNAETVESQASLTLNDASIGGGLVTNKGTLNLQDGSAVGSGVLDNSAGNIYVSGSNNALHDETITNNALEVLAGAVLTIDLGSSVDNSNGTVTVDSDEDNGNATLNLNNASITGGDVVNSGIIKSTGGGFINNADITNNGTIESTGGTLTIDPVTTHTLTNSGSVEANGGELDLTSEAVSNSGTLQAIDNGTLKLTSNVVTNSGTGTVSDAFGSTIDLINAAISGGTVTLDGTLNASGTSAIHGATINVDAGGILESTAGGTLTIDTTTAATLTNSGTVEANGGELDITTELVTNENILQAIDNSTLKLSSTSVTNAGGAVSDASGSTIDLINANISGGTVTLDGTLNASGTSAIHGATINIDASGVLESTGGTLTIDTTAAATLTNSGTVEADGGELDITTETVANKNALQAVSGGKLKLNSTTVTNTGTVTVDHTSELDLTSASILGGSLSNDGGTLDSLSGSNTISAAVTNTGTIEVKSGTLDLAGGVTGGGHLIVDQGARLELGGADRETVTLQGGAGTTTLQLDNTSAPFNGTITVNATGGGTFDVNGQGGIITSSGDGLDVNASGTSGAPANVAVNLGGAIKGAANGIVVTQNGYGSLTVDTTGAVTGNGAGDIGLLVQNLDVDNSADISVTATGGASGDLYGIDVVNHGSGNIALEAGGSITTASNADSKYGIRVVSEGTGSETIKTDAGSSISSAGTGINAVNIDASIGSGAQSSITVTTYGTIHSHAALNNDNSVAGGIYAGYRGVGSPTEAKPDLAVNGSVTVNNNDTLTTADTGYGINAYNYGQGSVTVNDGTDPTVSATQITAGQTGIGAYANSGGTGDVTINVGDHATISGGTTDGIQAFTVGSGKISVTTSATDSITGGTSGIVATNADMALDGSLGSTIKVTAYGTINSGASPDDVQTAAGILAGYSGNGANGPSPTQNDSVHGEVTVDTYASITTQAGYGIDAFNWGTGDVTVIAEASSSINAAGVGIGAFANDGGSVSVTQLKGGVDKGSTGLSAHATGAGTIAITNDGEIDGLSGDGILVNQTSGTGATTITNSGTVTGITSDKTAVVSVHENTSGLGATIDNSGTIGAALDGTWQVAIYEDGGNVSIDNTGTINGAFNVANGSFTNETSGVWNDAGTSGFGTASGTAFTIDNAGIINLSGASLSGAHGLTITDSGTIDAVSGTDAIDGANIAVTATAILESTGGTLTLDAQSPVINDAGGTIEASGGGTLNINGTLDNAGTIVASGGTVNIGGAVSDTGSATIASNGILHFSSSVVATQTITFQDGTGTLAVSDTTDFHAAIAGFGAGDKIDLTGVALTAGEYDVWANGLLSVYSGTTLEAQLKLSGTYAQGDFALASDGHGGTEVVWSTEQASPVSGLDNAGNPVEGYGVTANLSDPTSSTGVTYTWLENGAVVGNGATFTPTDPSQLNKALDVVIGFTDDGVTEQVTELVGTVTAAPAVSFGTTSPVTIVAGTALQLGGLQATFADAGSDTITATLAVVDGTLVIGNEQGIGSANNAGSITLTGTLAQINAALASGVTYTPNAGFGGNDTLGLSVSDKTAGGTFTGNGTLTIAVDKLTAGNDAIGPNGSGWVFDTEDGHYYRYVSTSVNYATAQSGAASDGAYLATITGADENSFIANLLGSGGSAWTAGETHNANPNGSDPNGNGHSPDTSAIWSWNAGPESGNLFTYTNWHQGEPNGGFGATDAAMQVNSNGTWNDVPTPEVLNDGTSYFNAGYVEEWGGLSGEIAFNKNAPTTIDASVLLANDSDSLGKTITITAVGDANHHSANGGTVTLNGNVITYTPAAGYSGADSFTYTISDGTTTSTATVSFEVASGPAEPFHWVNSNGGDFATAADWGPGLAPAATDDAVVDASGAYTVTISGSDAAVAHSLTITSAGAGADVQDKGSLTLGGALTIDAGSFSLMGGSLSAASIDVESAGHFIAEGSVSAPIANNGGMVQAYGDLTLSGTVTGNGTFDVNGHTLTFGGSVAGGTVDFDADNSGGTLAVAEASPGPSNFGAAISHFGSNDTIDLTGVGYTSGEHAVWTQGTDANAGGGTLAIYDANNKLEASFHLNGTYTTGNFAVASNGAATPGTDIHFTTPTGAAPTVTLGPADFNFDGQEAAVGQVATSSVGNAGDGTGVTLAGSVNWNGTGEAGQSQLLFYNGSTSDAGFGVNGIVTANGQLDLQIQNGGIPGIDTGITIDAGQWHNIVLTHANGQFTLYVDGTAEYSTSADVQTLPGEFKDYMQIGGASVSGSFHGEGFTGSIANVSVWNTALTQTQIQATDFNALTGSESGLAGYYPLNDGAGTTVTDAVSSAGNLHIQSGEGNGTWSSATGDVTLTIAPDGLQHTVFPLLNINDSASTTIDHATVTWNITGNGTVSGEGVDALASADGISISYDPNAGGQGVRGYQLTGNASLADYESVLSHLTFQTTDLASNGTTFTVTVNDGANESAAVTTTVDIVSAGTVDHWTNSNGGDFATASNWSLGHVPGSGDNVVIDAPGTYTVTSAADETVNTLTVGSVATLDITSDTFTIANGNGATSNNDALIETAGALVVDGGTLDNNQIVIDRPGSLTLDNAVLSGGSLTDAGNIEIIGLSTISGVAITGEGIGAHVPTYTWSASSGDWSTAANWSSGIVATGFDNVDVHGGVTVSHNESANDFSLSGTNASLSITNNATLSVYGAFSATGAQTIDIAQGTLSVTGSISLDNMTVDLGGAGSGGITTSGTLLAGANFGLSPSTLTLGQNLTFDVYGGQIESSELVINDGTIQTVGSGSFSVPIELVNAASGSLIFSVQGETAQISLESNAGSIAVTNGDIVSLFAEPVYNTDSSYSAAPDSGSISVGSGGHLTINGAIGGSGNITIDDGGTLEISGAVSNDVVFAGGVGTLQLDNAPAPVSGEVGPAGFTGTVSGLALGDAIDFEFSQITSAQLNNGTLTVTLTNGQTDTLTVGSLPDGTSFQVQADNHGGQELIVASNSGSGSGTPPPTYTWTDGNRGDWGTAANWSGDVVPSAQSNATIAGNGVETITVSDNEAVDALTINDANATLNVAIDGTLSVSGEFAVSAALAISVEGTLSLNGGGAATIDSTLDLGVAGQGFGTLKLGSGTSLTLGENQTLDVFGGQIENSNQISNSIPSFDNEGSISTVNDYGSFNVSVDFTNHGSVILSSKNGWAQFNDFVDNEGAFAVENGENVTIWGLSQFNGSTPKPAVNNGDISVSTGGELTIFGTLAGTGDVTIGNGSVLVVQGMLSNDVSFVGDGPGTLEFGLSGNLAGTLLGFGIGDAIDFMGSTISSYSISNDTLTVTLGNGQVDTITLDGPLPGGDALQVELDNGGGEELVLVAAPAAPPPTLPTYTWADGTSGDWSNAVDWSGGVIPGAASNASITGVATETVAVSFGTVNQLTLDNPDATLAINGFVTVNDGLTIQAAQAINITGTLSLGGAVVLDHTTINLGGSGLIGTLQGSSGSTLTLGSDLVLDVSDGQIFGFKSIDNEGTIATVGNGATLSFELAEDTLTNHGTITLSSAGGSATIGLADNEGRIVVENGQTAVLEQSGPFQGPIVDNGTISVGSGGHLAVEDMTGSGSLAINDGGTLEIIGVVTNDVTFAADGIGTLQMGPYDTLSGTISGLAVGDAIDFSGSTILETALNGNSLTVTFSNGLSETLTLAGSLPNGDSFQAQLDGHGGSELVVVNGPSSVNPGTIDVGAGQFLTLDNTSLGNATVNVEGSLLVEGNTGGNGTIIIDNSGHVEVAGALATGQIVFAGQGTLQIDQPASFSSSIAGLSTTGQVIDLAGFDAAHDKVVATVDVPTSFNGNTTLTVTDETTGHSTNITLAGYNSDAFATTSDGHGGVDVSVDPVSIFAQDFTLTHNADGTTTINDLGVTDSDGASSLTVSASTEAAGSSVTPDSVAGSLQQVEFQLSTNGITYNPGSSPPQQDQVNLTVTDSLGNSATEHFIFNQAGSGPGITLNGTAGNDVIFATGNADTMTGGGGIDQFVFKHSSANDTGSVQHIITDFDVNLDTIDLRQLTNVGSAAQVLATATQQTVGQETDTLLTLDNHQTLLLKNVTLNSLHASDFIVTPH